MKKHHLELLVPGIFAAAVLALAVGVGAQPSTHAGHSPAAQSPEAAPMAVPDDSMMAKCQAMMAKKKAMRDELAARDAALDELVAKMNNAAAASGDTDAMLKPMAAVLNELVAQRKAHRPMMMKMQPEMMGHMMRHMEMHGTKGAMECPMMKMGMAHESETEE